MSWRIPAAAMPMLCAFALSVSADADGPDFYRVRDVAPEDVLHIRTAPNAEAEIAGAIPPDGDGIRNLGCEGRMSLGAWQDATQAERAAAADRVWCRIGYDDITGWVPGRNLAEGRAP